MIYVNAGLFAALVFLATFGGFFLTAQLIAGGVLRVLRRVSRRKLWQLRALVRWHVLGHHSPGFVCVWCDPFPPDRGAPAGSGSPATAQ